MMEGHVAYSPIPALLVLVPLLGAALMWPVGRRRPHVRNFLAVAFAAATFAGAAALVPLIAEKHVVECVVPFLLGNLEFRVDPFGMLFALFTSFVWLCSTLYALDYLHHEKKHDRYHTVNLAVLAANMGVVLAGDLITLYLFFEALGLAAYLLVVHTETDAAKRASIKYFWMTVAGGFALVGGIFIAYGIGSTGFIGPIPVREGTEVLRWVAALLMIAGFGVKAGMLPLHIWLPEAHPVAPSPASALLSGVMIKAGAYGIFRVVTALFRPEIAEEIDHHLWQFSSDLGLVVLWIGMATMFIGVVLALGQHNAKRMLAYHSVSQMGFILAGIGAAGYLSTHGAMGVAGGLYHIVNHALFKACLFLGVGAVFFRTGELDMYKLGGLWKKMPLTFVFTLIAAFGITGVPLFNGFVSKCLIHHALVEAYEYHEVTSLFWAEKLFIVTCGGTACSFIKLIWFVFLRKPQQVYGAMVKDAPPRMLVSMGGLAAAITVLGLRPQLLINGVFTPGLHLFGIHPEILQDYLSHYYLSGGDLMSVVYAFAIGFAVFFVGIKFGLFHLHPPKWFGVDYWYVQGAKGFVQLCVAIDKAYESYRAGLSVFLATTRRGYRASVTRVGRLRRRMLVTLTTGAPSLRHQHLVQNAFVLLESERQQTVREACSLAVQALRSEGADDPGERRERIEAVRDIATYMASRLFNERMGVIGDIIREGHVQPNQPMLEATLDEVAGYRTRVAEIAMRLAPQRMAGVNVLREISSEMNHILSEERFDLRLRGALPTPHPIVVGRNLHDLGRTVHDAFPSRASLETLRAEGLSSVERAETWVSGAAHTVPEVLRAEGLTRLERAGTWMVDMARIVIEVMTQERVPWMIEERVDDATVVATRRAIQRYARDMSFNVAVIVIVFVAFFAALSSAL